MMSLLSSRGWELARLTFEHLWLTLSAMLFAVAIGLPLGILLTRKRALARPVIGFANIVQTVPSLALFGLLLPVPWLGEHTDDVLGTELGLVARDRFEFCWIVDFPMYEWNEEEKKIDFSHNPFSMPNLPAEQFLALDPNDKEKILGLKAIQYDIVCNGTELSSGAIRNHRPDVMKKAFAIAGYDESVLEQKFGGMLRALSLGAPPHGGIAPGVDRIVMLLCGEENLREVVVFPMNQKAEDLLMGAPSEATPKQLRELHIRLNLPN